MYVYMYICMYTYIHTYIKSKLGITDFAHKTKAYKNFSSERDLNPRPSDYMSNALPSEPNLT